MKLSQLLFELKKKSPRLLNQSLRMADEEQNIGERVFFSFVIAFGICGLVFIMTIDNSRKIPVPKIELASMDFTVQNITMTRLSAKWDLSISTTRKMIILSVQKTLFNGMIAK